MYLWKCYHHNMFMVCFTIILRRNCRLSVLTGLIDLRTRKYSMWHLSNIARFIPGSYDNATESPCIRIDRFLPRWAHKGRETCGTASRNRYLCFNKWKMLKKYGKKLVQITLSKNYCHRNILYTLIEK